MAATEIASRIRPYVGELVENNYAREQLRDAVDSFRAAYRRASKRRVEPTRDEKLRRQIRQAAASVTEATKALKPSRRKTKKARGTRRVLLVIGVGAVGAAVAFPVSKALRRRLRGGDSGGGETAPAAVSAEVAASAT